MRQETYWPKYIVIGGDYTSYRTCLRKQHTDGKWYKCFNLSHSIESLIHNVYMFQLLGIVDLDLHAVTNGRAIFELDECQDSEVDRLTNTYLNDIHKS